MTTITAPPTENVLRAWHTPDALEYRADSTPEGGGVGTMAGHFAVFNRWTEIDSTFEGQFVERIAPGAFADTFRDQGERIRVLYDHGSDPAIGNKPLGTPDVLAEDERGARYEVDLFDTEYVRELLPALKAGALGASFRFRVTDQEWAETPEPSDDNPKGLPERTITGVHLMEFGPVTFPAYAEATAGLRSMTDTFNDHLRDPQFVARFTERVGLGVAEKVLATLPPDGRNEAEHTQEQPPDGHSDGEPQPTGGSLLAVAMTDVAQRRSRS